MKPILLTSLVALALLATTSLRADDPHTSSRFAGAKASQGTVTHAVENGKHILTLSDDFVIPDTPAPHWQIVDSNGNVYLLQRLKIKGDKFNKSITLPRYIQDIARVQIWCAWAEANLGEASFRQPVQLARQ